MNLSIFFVEPEYLYIYIWISHSGASCQPTDLLWQLSYCCMNSSVWQSLKHIIAKSPCYLIKIKVIKLIQFNHSWQTLGMLKALYRSLNEQLTGLDLIDGEYENKKNKIIEHFHNFTTHRCNGKCMLLSLWIWLQVVVYVSFKFLLIQIGIGLESVFSDFKAHGFVL